MPVDRSAATSMNWWISSKRRRLQLRTLRIMEMATTSAQPRDVRVRDVDSFLRLLLRKEFPVDYAGCAVRVVRPQVAARHLQHTIPENLRRGRCVITLDFRPTSLSARSLAPHSPLFSRCRSGMKFSHALYALAVATWSSTDFARS